MSIKHAFKKEREGVYHLDILKNTTMKVPAKIFLTDELYEILEENIGEQIINASSLEGVEEVVITPDVHIGYGVPIGCVVSSKTHLYPTAAGFDVNCGVALLKTNLSIEKFVDKKIRRLFIEKISERVPLGKGKHRVKKQKSFAHNKMEEFINKGLSALPYVIDKNKHERIFLPVTGNYKLPKKSEDCLGELGSLGGG